MKILLGGSPPRDIAYSGIAPKLLHHNAAICNYDHTRNSTSLSNFSDNVGTSPISHELACLVGSVRAVSHAGKTRLKSASPSTTSCLIGIKEFAV